MTDHEPPASMDSAEELLIRIPSTIVHLIDKEQSMELAYGDLELILLRQNDAAVAVLARIGDQSTREKVEENSAAYWTTLAPNVEEYSSGVARMIAAGSGQVIRGILWCGDVTADRLKWGTRFLRSRVGKRENAHVSPQCFQRIARVKKMTKMSEDVATGILSGVIKVSETITETVVNSKVGKKFFNMLPGEVILASLDGFNKVCDAVEVAGKKVMSTSSEATTELMRDKYGDEAGKATNEGFGAAGHALGTAWTMLKLRKALNPKRAVKPTTLVKAAAGAAASKPKS